MVVERRNERREDHGARMRGDVKHSSPSITWLEPHDSCCEPSDARSTLPLWLYLPSVVSLQFRAAI